MTERTGGADGAMVEGKQERMLGRAAANTLPYIMAAMNGLDKNPARPQLSRNQLCESVYWDCAAVTRWRSPCMRPELNPPVRVGRKETVETQKGSLWFARGKRRFKRGGRLGRDPGRETCRLGCITALRPRKFDNGIAFHV